MKSLTTTESKSQLLLIFPYLRDDGQLLTPVFQPCDELKKKLFVIHVEDQKASYMFTFPRIQEQYEFIKPCMDILQNILLPFKRIKYGEDDDKIYWKYFLNDKLIPHLKKLSLEQIYCFGGILYNLALYKEYTALYNSSKKIHTVLKVYDPKDVKYKLVIYKP